MPGSVKPTRSRGRRVAPRVELVGGGDAGGLQPPLDADARALDEVGGERRDHAADQRGAPRGRVASVPARGAHAARNRELLDRGLLGQGQPVLEIVRLLRDLVGPVDDLRLEAAARLEAEPSGKSSGKRKVPLPGRVLEDPLAHVVREVQARLLVALLQAVDDAHRLVVVLEAAGLRMALAQQPVQHVLARSARTACGPRSWPRAIASVRSSFSPSARAALRAIWATSIVCVRRVRKWSPS